jgi:hypothetical protein
MNRCREYTHIDGPEDEHVREELLMIDGFYCHGVQQNTMYPGVAIFTARNMTIYLEFSNSEITVCLVTETVFHVNSPP